MSEKNTEHNCGKYDDIINLPHYTSLKHPRMSMQARAAQFSAFSALNGHSEAIMEVAKFTEEQFDIQTEKSEENW